MCGLRILSVLIFSVVATQAIGSPQGAQLQGLGELTVSAVDRTVNLLTQGSFTFVDANGQSAKLVQRDALSPVPITEQEITNALSRSQIAPSRQAALWAILADLENTPLATLPIVEALIKVTNDEAGHAALWSELAGLSRARAAKRLDKRAPSLLTLFEENREKLLPLIGEAAEAEVADDDLLDLTLYSRVFGADRDDSVTYISARAPAAVARYIERVRGRGRPAHWEYLAYEGMIRWKTDHIGPEAKYAPRSMAELDKTGATFITIFNCLHELDEGYREVILRDLGAYEIFDAVVGGEKELYRLGTSGYRNFLHPVIMSGIAKSGSFEAFLKQESTGERLEGWGQSSGHRGLVFLRVASSFGFLEQLLQTVQDRRLLINDVIASLADTRNLAENSNLVLDALSGSQGSSAVSDFKKALLDQLYTSYRSVADPAWRYGIGGVLAVHQNITGDHRDQSLDQNFDLAETPARIPFSRLFEHENSQQAVHRIFMRMDNDADALQTFESFRKSARAFGAVVDKRRSYSVFHFKAADRRVDIYVNDPTPAGTGQGIANIAEAVGTHAVQTVIGRGHTSIVGALQADAKRVLGNRISEVAAVFVGACGGDAAVRELVSTFGYVPFITTKSTGRQQINNSIVLTYVAALMSLDVHGHLPVAEVLDKALQRFTHEGVADDLRSDAGLYRVNIATVLAAQLFDRQKQ